MKSTSSPTEFDKNNRDATSIPAYVFRKNSSRGAKHGPSERQKMYYQAKQMPKKGPSGKARTPSNDTFTKFVVCHRVENDRIAVEKHIYIATRAERIQNSKHWILTINADGLQQPLSQRPDFAQAKRECKRLHDEHLARTQEEYKTIPRSKKVRQRKGQTFEGNEEYDYAVEPKTGWRFDKGSRGNLQTTSSSSWANLQTASSSSSTRDQTHGKTSKWNSQHSSSPDDW